MLYRHIKLNDLVSSVRFSLNGSPHIKTLGPINRLSLFSANAHCRSIDRIFPCNGDASHTTNTKLRRLLSFKTRTVTECDLLPPAALWQKQAIKNLSSKLRLEKLQYVISVYAKFYYIWSKTVGAFRDKKLLVFWRQTYTRMDTRTHRLIRL